MNVKGIIKKLDFSLEKDELKIIKKISLEFVKSLKNCIKRTKINADVFIGGSFAKETLTKSDEYDVDVFVRFDWNYEDLSLELEKILKVLSREKNVEFERVHGSRDYFKLTEGKLTFEIVPVVKIKKPKEERNVTDLSYFHVNYIKKHLNEKMKKEVLLLKKFCKASKVYGAESYIRGFSGYALECLIVNYKTFEKTLKELLKVKDKEIPSNSVTLQSGISNRHSRTKGNTIKGNVYKERLIIDPAKHFKKKNDVFFAMNENKIHGPIILVDPTWKERNVLSALSLETLKIFQENANNFLKNPSENYFYLKKFDEKDFKEEAKIKNSEFLKIILETDRQEGDIAGTKMKKFSKFLIIGLKKYFYILKDEFVYEGDKKSKLFLILKSKEEIIKIGPPLDREKDVSIFKKINKNTFEKNGYIHAKMIVDFSAKSFLEDFARIEKNRKLKEMGIVGMKIEG